MFAQAIKSASTSQSVLSRDRLSSLHPAARLRQWTEQRAAKRHRVSFSVNALVRGRELLCILNDVSGSGFRLHAIPGLIPGDRVEVKFGDDQSILGEVVWGSAGGAGCKLLAMSDRDLVDRLCVAGRSGIYSVPEPSAGNGHGKRSVQHQQPGATLLRTWRW